MLKTRHISRLVAVVAILAMTVSGLIAQSRSNIARAPLQSLGIPVEATIGFDKNGVPNLCGTRGNLQERLALAVAAAKPPKETNPPTVLPAGMRAWECVPGVIRNDSVDSFRLEVDVNGLVNRVTLQTAGYVVGADTQNLSDDGLNGDRVASDRIFTSERIRFPGLYIPEHLYGEQFSPAGLHFVQIGTLRIVETNGITNQFLITPTVGVLSTNVPLVETYQLASNIVISPHLVNISTGKRQTQLSLRATFSAINSLTIPTYSVLPDAFDFFVFFSMDHAEYVPYLAYPANGIAGVHSTVQVKYSGTGLATNINDSAYYGSTGRLLGINILDAVHRGVYDGVASHELLHQWASHTSGSLGLDNDGSHYPAACSAHSLVGGTHWTTNADGTFTTDCDDMIYGATNAPPLDKYMMGLIPGSSVPALFVATNGAGCNSIISNDYRIVTIGDIQAVHGVRTPTPANAQKNFGLCFVAESFGRLLTPTEITFYDILAGHYTKPIAPTDPTPPIPGGWSSIDRYFGEGSKWSSDVIGVIRPIITSIERLTNGTARISGMGYPGRSYRLLRSTNFVNWSTITNKIAGTNGVFVLVDSATTPSAERFYRVATP